MYLLGIKFNPYSFFSKLEVCASWTKFFYTVTHDTNSIIFVIIFMVSCLSTVDLILLRKYFNVMYDFNFYKFHEFGCVHCRE